LSTPIPAARGVIESIEGESCATGVKPSALLPQFSSITARSAVPLGFFFSSGYTVSSGMLSLQQVAEHLIK